MVSHVFKYLIKLQGRYWWLSLFLWVVLAIPAQATQLRVAIEKDVPSVKIGSSTTALVRDGAGKTIGQIAAMSALEAQPKGGKVNLDRLEANQIFIEPSGGGYVWIGDRWYRGKVRLLRSGSGLMVINHVDLESYLYSVVGAEAVASWPLEALKAQAVSARSYALYKRKTSSNSLYDLDTTTVTQVYKGLNSEYTTTHQAVDGTRGQVMTYGGNVILAVFHSSSGGHTENVEDIWTSPLAYLRGVIDYDQKSPVFQWNKTFSRQQISSLIGGVGEIKTMMPEKTTPRGRVISMKVVGDRSTKVVSGDTIRKVLNLRSTLFSVSNADGNNFQVNGRGFGHGLGLSQWGAYYLAKQGVNYRTILDHYYQNSSLTRLS